MEVPGEGFANLVFRLRCVSKGEEMGMVAGQVVNKQNA